jgi:uncharacterized protein YecE (DUF72 family)
VSIRVGTCSWADDSLSALWYPSSVKSAEQRLRFYAERFDTVEVNSSYYAIPEQATAARWVERTPPGFVFHVKAFGLMTRHRVLVEQLPPDLRAAAVIDHRGAVDSGSSELREAVFSRFHNALEPLRHAGKLGGVLIQLSPSVHRSSEAFEYLEWAQERLAGDEMLVEFRHRSWLEPDHCDEVLDFLERRGMTYVIVDAPRFDVPNLVPTVVANTTSTAYLRLHGRNAATWNRRGASAAERFDYLYGREELAEWVRPLRELESAADRVWVMFNNNGRTRDVATGREIAQAPVNAVMMRDLLGLPAVPAPEQQRLDV